MLILFWICAGLLGWYYVGYPLFLYGLAHVISPKAHHPAPGFEPTVSVIIIAHNEERVIVERVHNCLNLDYPPERLDVLVASDGSTDRTVELVKELGIPRVAAFDSGQRCKAQTRNWAVEQVKAEIVCFTDADTMYEADCVRKLMRHYADRTVGCVGGELVSSSFSKEGVGEAQGLYWKYEYLVRRLQSRAGLLAKVSGANMSMRRSLYQPVPDTMDIDQLAGPMTTLQGYRVIHDPEAVAREEFPTKARGEFRARVRLTIRGLTALWHARAMLNIFRRPLIALSEFSSRLLRYLIPFLLSLIFVSNLVLVKVSAFYASLLLLQLLFYTLAMSGAVVDWRNWPRLRVWTIPFSFSLAQAGIMVGAIWFLLGRRLTFYHTSADIE